MDKTETLKHLEEEHKKLREAVSNLDNKQLDQTWYDQWSVKQIVAHILGWEREMITILERLARGERPTPEGVDYSDSDAWNARFAREWAPIQGNTVLAAWDQAHMVYVKAAQAVPDDRFGTKEDGSPNTVNRILEGNGYGHYQEHLAPILAWRKQQGL
jgi:hypothetical protein